MEIKKGVILNGLSIEMTVAMRIIDEEYKKYGYCDMVITCGLDGTHMAGSLHYPGYALDIRVNTVVQRTKTVSSIRKRLKTIDKRYGVFLHNTHLHVQYKPDRYNELWCKYAN